jgi:RND family efflux transporter MFP subunit
MCEQIMIERRRMALQRAIGLLRLGLFLTAALGATLVSLGCHSPGGATPAAKGAPKPPEVLVSRPLSQRVQDSEVFTGRTESSQRADLRARATGHLEKANFQEGALVEAGALLFVLDQLPYRAELARTEAVLTQAKARYDRVTRDWERSQALIAKSAISEQEFDLKASERNEALAAVKVAEANVDLAKLDLDHTEVRSPFAGRIGRRMVDPGNLVKEDETILATLVAERPMYVYFDVDERTLMGQLNRRENPMTENRRLQVGIGLAGEEGFPHEGVITFMDNRVDPNTGSMWMRAEFVVGEDVMIEPGIFARVRVPLGEPYEALLIPEQAVGTDQGRKFVFVVQPDNKVSYRPIKVGQLHGDLRVVTEGLDANEKVVFSGLQRIRAGVEVLPQDVNRAAISSESARNEEPR